MLFFISFLIKKKEYFEMYYSKILDNKKDDIWMDMVEDGYIWILICINFVRMGVNFYGVNNIIYYGLLREMDIFV